MRAGVRSALTAERDHPTQHAVLDAAFTEDDTVALGLCRLKTRKAAGADGLPVESLKSSSTRVFHALAKLFNAV